MSPEKDERVGKGGSMVKKPAPSNICENDSKSIQDEEEVVPTVTHALTSFCRPNQLNSLPIGGCRSREYVCGTRKSS